MAVVLGIPLIKGNSQEIVSVRYDPANYSSQPLSGFAQAYTVGGVEPDMVPFDQGRFLGFCVEVNTCAYTATVIRAGLGIPVVSDGATPPAVGDQVWVNVTGDVVAPNTANSFAINGTVEEIGVNAIDGKTGVAASDAVLINFGSGRSLAETV